MTRNNNCPLITLRVPEKIKRKFAEICKRKGKTMSAMLMEYIMKCVEEGETLESKRAEIEDTICNILVDFTEEVYDFDGALEAITEYVMSLLSK